MIKLSLHRKISLIGFALTLVLSLNSIASPLPNEREEEIQAEVWGGKDPKFNTTEIPEKWAERPAIIIARDFNLSYHKLMMSNNLKHTRLQHVRIKLNGQKALEDYAQFSIPKDGQIQNVKFEFYAGFKIIKPSGEEIIITQKDGSPENQEVNGRNMILLKIAIPNLEPGDILDYYIAEDRTINLYGAKYFGFDPAIYVLTSEYPIMKQRITFDVMRKCYVNVKTLNGAPEFKHLEDINANQNSYSIEDEDRESVEDMRWFYEYRSLPNIKFKATYAANETTTSSFQGSRGEIKTNVSKSEIAKLTRMVFLPQFMYKDFTKYMKKHYKKEKNKDTLARKAFYVFRNQQFVEYKERRTLDGYIGDESSTIRDLGRLSNYYRSINIPSEIIIGVPRHISEVDDIIFENELIFMLKVLSPTPFYISEVSTHSLPGDIMPQFQGTKAYSTKSTTSTYWTLSDTEIPTVPSEGNNVSTKYVITVPDIKNGHVVIASEKAIVGADKIDYQTPLLDIYDYLEEEKKMVMMEDFFEGLKGSSVKNYTNKKDDYFSHRDHDKYTRLMDMVKSDFELEVDTVKNLRILQTGRHHSNPAFIYAYDIEINDAVKRAGPNYIVDIGRFIEEQVKIDQIEREREYDIYLSSTRSFYHEIQFTIPDGYEAEGIENLIMAEENETGSFVSSASIEGNVLTIKTKKHYYHNYEPVENWDKMQAFLNLAAKFNEQKLLLRKK